MPSPPRPPSICSNRPRPLCAFRIVYTRWCLSLAVEFQAFRRGPHAPGVNEQLQRFLLGQANGRRMPRELVVYVSVPLVLLTHAHTIYFHLTETTLQTVGAKHDAVLVLSFSYFDVCAKNTYHCSAVLKGTPVHIAESVGTKARPRIGGW